MQIQYSNVIRLTANNQPSHTTIEWPIILELIIHKLRLFDLLLLLHWLLDWFLRRRRHVFLSRFLIIISIVISIIQVKLLLYPCNQSRYFVQRNLILLEDMRMFSIELTCCLFRIGVQHQFLKKDCVHFFLGIVGTLLVVDSDDGRLEPHAESWVNWQLPR